MKKLTDIVKKYHKELFVGIMYSSFSLMCLYQAPKTWNHFSKIKESIQENRSMGNEVVIKTPSNLPLFESEISIYDKNKNLIEEHNTKPINDLLHWVTLQLTFICGYGLLKMKNHPYNDFKLKKEKITDTTITAITAGVTSSAMYNLTNGLSASLQYEIIYNSTMFLTLYLGSLYNKNIFEKKLNNPDLVSDPFRDEIRKYSSFIKNIKESKKLLLQKKKNESLHRILDSVKIARTFNNRNYIALSDCMGPYKEERNLICRAKTFLKNSYESHIDLLINDIFSFSPFLEYDINRAIKNCPDQSLEFRILDAEFITDKEKSNQQWRQIYEIAKNNKFLSPISLKTKNIVSILNSNILKRNYILKQESKKDLESEIKQTEYLNQNVFSKLDNVETVDIIAELHDIYNDGFIDGGISVGIFKFIESESLSDVLKRSASSEQTNLLEKLVKINASTANYGLSEIIVDKKRKISDEISNLNIDSNSENALLENYDVLLKFSEYFDPVYDCDGHSDNRLVKKINDNWVFIPIDNEIRPLSDPIYMLVKGIEYKTILPFDNYGIEARNKLVKLHFDEINQNIDKEIQEAHYYLSIPLKLISYSLLSITDRAEKNVFESYKKSSLFALETLNNKYYHMFSPDESNKIANLKSLITSIEF